MNSRVDRQRLKVINLQVCFGCNAECDNGDKIDTGCLTGFSDLRRLSADRAKYVCAVYRVFLLLIAARRLGKVLEVIIKMN